MEESPTRLLLIKSDRYPLPLSRKATRAKNRIVVIFKGRDSARKGGSIKRITYRLNPRVVRVVALSTPTEKESSDENPCAFTTRAAVGS